MRTTRCLFFDRYDANIEMLFRRLDSSRDILNQNPLTFLGILVEEYGGAAERWRQSLDKDVVHLETKTGMTSLALPDNVDREHVDLERLTKDLHQCHTDLIFLDVVLNFQSTFAVFCKTIYEVLEDLQLQTGTSVLSNAERDAYMQYVSFHANENDFRKYQTASLQKRVQTQINVVKSHPCPPLSPSHTVMSNFSNNEVL